jgi:hypothetical protein
MNWENLSDCEAIWGGIIFAVIIQVLILTIRATGGMNRTDKNKE